MDYCGIEESGMYPSRPKQRDSHIMLVAKSAEDSQPEGDKNTLEATKVLVYKEKRPTICFVCLSNESLPIERRTYPFRTPGDLSKHFKRKHLANVREEESLRCSLCRAVNNQPSCKYLIDDLIM